tara:strand:- start:33 stop:701 length:669 start_codon:yes stop_codon:yes gene_type:complete
MINKKVFVFSGIIILIILVLSFIGTDFLSFLNHHNLLIKDFIQKQPQYSKIYFFIIYIIMAAISLPVAGLLGLLSGMIFNFFDALMLVSFASTIGALLSFLLSRYLFQDYFKNKYIQQYNIINNGFMKNGAMYLFALRMCMLFPYFLVNVLTGLTTIKSWLFYIVSQIGMLPGTIIIILIGSKIDKIISSSLTIDTEIIILFTLIGLLPIISKMFFTKYILK